MGTSRSIRSLLLACAAGLSLTIAASLAGVEVVTPAAEVRAACTAGHQLEGAVGVPGESVGTTPGAGVVEVRYTCQVDHRPQSLRLPSPHAHDALGSSVARGYFNDDDYEDVAAGIAGLDVGGQVDAGGVALFYGSQAGLSFGAVITQASAGVPGPVQTGAHFGAAVAAEGHPADRTSVLRIGEPGKTVSGHQDSGGFVDLPYVDGQLTKAREVTLDSPGIPGAPGTGDLLGATLTGSYAVGAPGRTVQGQTAAGAVLVSHLPPSDSPAPQTATLLTQASPGIPGVPEAGDRFGAALTRHWIGVPGESVGDVAGAGVVNRYYGGNLADNPGFQPVVIVPGDGDVPGALQAGAHFGASLVELGIVVDDTEWRAKTLLVGAPGYAAGGQDGAGSVTAIGVNEPGPDEGGSFSFNGQYQLLTARDPAAGAEFGSSLAQLGEETAAVGAPRVHGGRVGVYQTADEVALPLRLKASWKQQAGAPEVGDGYGTCLAGLPN